MNFYINKIKDCNLMRDNKIYSYNNHGFRLCNNFCKGKILFLPSGIYMFEEKISIKSIFVEKILEEKNNINILLFGFGKKKENFTIEIINKFKNNNISFIEMHTRYAVSTFNILLEENRLVSAVIFPIS